MSWVATAIVVSTLATSVYQGEKQASAQREASRNQKAAQRQSLLSSINAEKLAAQAERKANKRKPDVASILFREQAAANSGVGSTILAGREGGGGLLGSTTTLMG